MRKQILLQFFVSAFFLLALCIRGGAQSCDPITRPQLKEMLVQLGYEIKDLDKTPGKEKYEVVISKDGYTIPVAYEISASTNYIWLTVFLGPPSADTSVTNIALLKQNGKIQPCQFYITEKGKLMMGLAIENRGVTNALLRKLSESITTNVVSTKFLWEKK